MPPRKHRGQACAICQLMEGCQVNADPAHTLCCCRAHRRQATQMACRVCSLSQPCRSSPSQAALKGHSKAQVQC